MLDHKFLRDPISKAIINTDIEGLKRYREKKEYMRKLSCLKDEVDTIKDEMIEIKSLLKQLVEKQIR